MYQKDFYPSRGIAIPFESLQRDFEAPSQSLTSTRTDDKVNSSRLHETAIGIDSRFFQSRMVPRDLAAPPPPELGQRNLPCYRQQQMIPQPSPMTLQQSQMLNSMPRETPFEIKQEAPDEDFIGVRQLNHVAQSFLGPMSVSFEPKFR